jgi:nitrogen regulatory protein PII-like uncharacterized protein
VKILAVFLLSGFFLFLPAVGVVPLYAQHYRGMIPDSFQQMRAYDLAGVKSDEQEAIQNLEDHLKKLQDKVDGPVLGLETRVKFAEDEANHLSDEMNSMKTRVLELENRLSETESRLNAAESEIKILNVTQNLMLLAGPQRPISKPKPAASKPKAPVNKAKPAVDSSKNQ